jgi:hypothetical protein
MLQEKVEAVMVRLGRSIGFVAFVSIFVAACSSAPPPAPARPPPPREPEFATAELRENACDRLRDHVIVLFADEWARKQGTPPTSMSADEKWVLYNGFTQELQERGTLTRFSQSCASSLTPRKFQCGMHSKTRDGLIWCMQARG